MAPVGNLQFILVRIIALIALKVNIFSYDLLTGVVAP
jgi:hypothetical protein